MPSNSLIDWTSPNPEITSNAYLVIPNGELAVYKDNSYFLTYNPAQISFGQNSK